MKKLLILVFCLMVSLGFSQSIEQNWNFHSIVKDGQEIIEIGENDSFTLSEGTFYLILHLGS